MNFGSRCSVQSYSYNRSQRDVLFLKFILVKNSTYFGQTYFSCNIFKILERKHCDRLGMRLGETRNTYRILVHASWRVVIFKTVKFGTSILVKKKSFKNGHRKGRKRCIIWENYSKAEGERRTSICGPVTNGPRYRRAGRFIHNNQFKVELVRNLVAHGDAREVKWRGNWRMKCVASTLTPPPNVVYPALLKLKGTPLLPVVDWTDAPTDLNGFKWGKRKSGFCACAITFRTSCTAHSTS